MGGVIFKKLFKFQNRCISYSRAKLQKYRSNRFEKYNIYKVHKAGTMNAKVDHSISVLCELVKILCV